MHIFASIIYNLTLATSLYSVAMAIMHIRQRGKGRHLAQARSALELTLIAVAICVVILLYMLVSANFSIVYVAEHVNLQLPVFYRLTSLWAGQAGSMLWWNFLVVFFAWMAVRQMRRAEPALEAWMIVILMTLVAFFTAIGCFAPSSDPFRVFQDGEKLFAHAEGRGLNPLLQHWAMIIHPPILYFGYVSFAVPFAIAMSALLNGNASVNWIKYVRRWTIFSWFFLGVGILLGGKWAYEELGWGGYWAWDPVENASLMPWLTATAFLHSIIVQERRGMLKVWNMVLVSISFIMTVVGTALTRSGVVQSVHAFAQSNLGWFFLGFVVVTVAFCAYAIYKRYDMLKSAQPIESLLSREVGFLFNNVLLLASLFIVFFGTMYPTLSEWISGRRESVTAEWFNKFMGPMGILILFLTGLGPLLAWRTTSWASLLRNLRIPTLTGIIAAVAAYFIAVHGAEWSTSRAMAVLTFGISAFVIAGVLEEWLRATISRVRYSGELFLLAMPLVLFQNKRRFLGYMVHIALAILFAGFAGLAFATEGRLILNPGEAQSFGDYTIHVEKYEEKVMPEGQGGPRERGGMDAGRSEGERVPLYGTRMVTLGIYRNNRLIGRDTTEIRTYPMYNFREGRFSDSQNTSEPAIISTAFADVYLQLGGDEKGKLILQVWINPLVKWVWAGFAFFIIMGLLLLLPIGEKKFLSLWSLRFSITPQPKPGTKA